MLEWSIHRKNPDELDPLKIPLACSVQDASWPECATVARLFGDIPEAMGLVRLTMISNHRHLLLSDAGSICQSYGSASLNKMSWDGPRPLWCLYSEVSGSVVGE